MEKQRKLYAAISVALVLVCVVFFFGRSNSGGYDPIVLPPVEDDSQQSAGSSSELNDRVSMVAVTTETVQSVIASLHRPESYTASLTVTTYWSGGSGSVQTAVYVQQGLTRADTTANNGQVRHMLTDGENTAVWYGEETDYYRLPAGQFDADDELRLPSYEDVLELDEGQILEADHRYYGTVPCIFVSTEQEGYECCYYVRSADGLLQAAEIRWEGTLIYEAVFSSISAAAGEDSLFLLPDGSALS